MKQIDEYYIYTFSRLILYVKENNQKKYLSSKCTSQRNTRLKDYIKAEKIKKIYVLKKFF